jgi:hypothetical protein
MDFIYIYYIEPESGIAAGVAEREGAVFKGPRAGHEGTGRKVLRSFTATLRDVEMLEAIAAYHGFSKSATITSLVKKEFWRIFPRGTKGIRPDPGARIVERPDAH